jgi:hypothetical protein
MSQALTIGQLRIREIIYEFLPRYKQIDNGDELYSLCCEIRERFSKDLEINSDPCVCQLLINPKGISDTYLFWLYKMSLYSHSLVEIEYGEYSVNLDKFVYLFVDTDEQLKAYEGGDKITTTYRALFSFAENKEYDIPIGQWSTIYYEEDGILAVKGGGHHRLLACVLWGNNLITPQTLDLVKNLSDTDLHNAILTIESYLQKTDLKFNIYCIFKGAEDDMEKDLINEALEIKNFVKIVTPKEFDIIVDFLCYDARHRWDIYTDLNFGFASFFQKTVIINHFVQVLHEYRMIQSRTIQSRTWIQRIIAKINCKGRFSRDTRTDMSILFEIWFSKTQEVYNGSGSDKVDSGISKPH